jgi:hypothetical protein
MLSDYNINNQGISVESPFIIDEVSDTEIYIGKSISDSNTGRPVWRIKQVKKVATVWKFGYANGDQSFSSIWDNRYGYTYF